MQANEFDAILQQTLEDLRLTRGEKQVLRGVLADLVLDASKTALYQHRAFELARHTLQDEAARKALDWLEDVVKVLQQNSQGPQASQTAEAYFSPGDNCPGRIAAMLNGAKSKIDICVFTITDDRITSAILAAHARKLSVRIITDDEKMGDMGSDIDRLQAAGIPVRIDRSQYHMHHKFAILRRCDIVDRQLQLDPRRCRLQHGKLSGQRRCPPREALRNRVRRPVETSAVGSSNCH
jgi:phosphatidylserine/phosphatidylglycerophosphate/cardiolipin synthase-like enzyme